MVHFKSCCDSFVLYINEWWLRPVYGSYTLLYVQILRNLKDAFWPFQHDHAGSLFLRAARAANCIDRSNVNEDRYFGFIEMQYGYQLCLDIDLLV